MILQKYDMLIIKKDSCINISSITKSMSNILYIRIFLIHCLRDISHFIKAITTYSKDGMGFELLNIDIDNKENLVYFSESWYDYKSKPTTPEIEALLEAEDFIQLCKMGFLDYAVMTKDNFMHLLLTWDTILNQLPSFALLYLDDKGWYDIKAFDSQTAMEQFVADHTTPKITKF
ncbi:MAG: hypothetical protein Q8Q60_00150 [Candidatus Chromulinivorax sp.]|nr:hypothetical protein [Candidatus Chromulinivorax sp.]